ncbi:hypothetical protein G6F56_014513 [Rhizopus delemar]|nr:hypothetical protein G6F56_014513 [Rhizopus delemar]
MDGVVLGRAHIGAAGLRGVPMLLQRRDFRRHGEVVGRYRRRGRPFQAARVPGVARQVAVLLAVLDADGDLDQQRQDAQADDARAN